MPFFVKGEKIVLKKDGTWLADGVEITHEQTRDLFFRAIHWDEAEKKHYLEIGYERIFIEVEDTAWFVTSLALEGAPARARISDSTEAPITSLSYENGCLYLRLDDGRRARFLSAPYYELLAGLREDASHYFVILDGRRHELAPKSAGEPSGLDRHGCPRARRHRRKGAR